ncbi:MAG: hypothetical protein LC679_15045 [Intrasporangiaceae bacterium]|nr:hypothetical protein [Intrasporangiaceae bacterium]
MELDRIRRRFTELSVPDAEAGMRRARPLLDHLCGELGHAPAPDLGPAVIPDQLTVLVHDAYLGGVGEGVAQALATLRRSLYPA